MPEWPLIGQIEATWICPQVTDESFLFFQEGKRQWPGALRVHHRMGGGEAEGNG